MSRFLLFFVCLLVCGSFYTYGQNLNPINLSNVIPPTPEAAAMGKYIGMPVGYNTGVAEVNVPLYTISTGSLQVPLNLSYNSVGVRVEEVPSWVGLGWNLNTGGSLTRVVRGLPDDVSSIGYMYTASTVTHILSLATNSDEYFDLMFNKAHNAVLDVEPDIYNYSILGYSGSFYYDQDSAKFIQTPVTNVKIEYVLNAGQSIAGWVLTLPNGVKAYFGTSTDNRTAFDFYNNDYNTSHASSGGGYSISPNRVSTPQHITTWQLLNIVSPTQEHIDYYYTSFQAFDFGMGGEVTDLPGMSGCQLANRVTYSSYYEQNITKSRLDHISTDQADVYFVPSVAARQDVVGDYRSLDSVVVKNKKGRFIQAFDLNTSYYSASVQVIPFPQGTESAAAAKRLYLKSVTQVGANGTSMPPYTFVYDTSHPLPGRFSTAQDYWGFYNGKVNNVLTPALSPAQMGIGTYVGFDNGADRTVDLNYAKSYSLTRIVYPTGGFTDFTYGANISNKVNQNGLQNGYQYSGLLNKYYQFNNNPQYQLASNPNQYVDSFTVSSSIQGSGSIVSSGCTDFNSFGCPVQIKITDLDDPTFVMQIKTASTGLTRPGRYKITATVYPNLITVDQTGDFTLAVSWKEDPDPLAKNIIVGGLRVEKIVNGDGNGKILSKVLKYNYFNDTTMSSGQLFSLPVHLFKIFCGSRTPIEPTVLRLTSGSALPLSGSDGKIIRYENITEYTADDTTAASKTEYTYSLDLYDIQNVNSALYPFGPNASRDWRTGLLLQKDEFVKTAPKTYQLVTREVNYYDAYQELFKNYGLKLSDYAGNADFYNMGINAFGVTSYNVYAERYLLDSTINYNYANTTLVTKTINRYNPQHNYLLAEQTSVNSKLQTVSTKTWYPSDYNDLPGYNINTLQQKNLIELPIKQQISKDGKLTDGRIITYNVYGEPANIYQYESATIKDTILHDKTVMVPQDYVLKSTASYHSTHPDKVIRIVSTNNYTKGFIWDYSVNYPIAEIHNADSADIAYTSFESDGTGYWNVGSSVRDSITQALTGNKSFALSSNINRTGLSSATTYIVSYYTKNATAFSITGTISGYPVKGKTVNGWTYFEHRVTGQSTIALSGTGSIDELRLYPVNAQMLTYTYSPLIGITSQCDANNNVGYYEYDNLNRVQLIRDAQRNILKVFCYNYAGQPSNCDPLFRNVVKSQVFTRTNCATGGVAGTATYTVPAAKYTSTISQTDADNKATADITANGQAYANTNAICTFSSVAKNQVFTRNNCATGGVAGTSNYIVPAGRYSSTISQADADSKATADITANGQTYANTNAICTFSNAVANQAFTRNTCVGSTPSSVTYTVPAARYTSTISQADADSKAAADITANGQAYANTNGTCTFKSVVKSQSFTRNNCATGGVPSAVTYTVAANAYSSLISQADADSKATADIAANGQNYANTNGTCTFSSKAWSGPYTRSNCAANYTPSTVIYSIPAGKYTSIISQADVDSKVVADYTTNGPIYANANGTCTPTVYAKLSTENQHISGTKTLADVVVRFYSDAACTVAYSVTNLDIEVDQCYHNVDANNNDSGCTDTYLYFTCTGSSKVLYSQTTIKNKGAGTSLNFDYWDYTLFPYPGYVIK